MTDPEYPVTIASIKHLTAELSDLRNKVENSFIAMPMLIDELRSLREALRRIADAHPYDDGKLRIWAEEALKR